MRHRPHDGVLPRRELLHGSRGSRQPHHLRGGHRGVRAQQARIGNDLSTPRPEYRFPGLVPGDRWCVTAVNWARAYNEGVAAPVVLAATNAAVLEIVPIAALQEHAVDVPGDLRSLDS
jgi:hypothetical protein